MIIFIVVCIDAMMAGPSTARLLDLILYKDENTAREEIVVPSQQMLWPT